ncbi:hypothetical protein ACQFX9_15420 [Aliinostoc sp. HNIBRCY26]|uniref:hypothetical protein n=1 Tax=Aliinostoc sp. HNIBRCY26 TaxID=3418997 RepID=UPI003D04CC54
MQTNLINQIGDWNPQLLREIKGRLHKRNVLIIMFASFLTQLVVFLYFQGLLPSEPIGSNRYCRGENLEIYNECFLDNSGNLDVNWQVWFQDTFSWLSILGIFVIIVAGSYLLINDLSTEERRDTFNFIRLSPQSPQSILFGKMLGVPILVYLGVGLAIPFHLWLGLNAQIPLGLICGFYILFLTASLFYFSGSLLFGLVGSWLGSFQAWLGSGAVLGFLFITQQVITSSTTTNHPFVILNFMNPYYVISSLGTDTNRMDLTNVRWFNFLIGNSWVEIIGFTVVIHLVGAYFFWQSLQRCFRDRNATMLSKQQSYWLTSAFTIITVGFANWSQLVFGDGSYTYAMRENIACLMFLDLCFCLYLIAALTPHRHTLQDWARYRHFGTQQGKKLNLVQDLIWGEKSPAMLAIAINVMIAITGLSLFSLVSLADRDDKVVSLVALIFAGSLTLIYAALTQLLLLMKHGQRLFLTNGVMIGVIILPVVALGMLFASPVNYTFLWLFSVAAPVVVLYPQGELAIISYFMGMIGHAILLGIMLSQIALQLNKAGESATKAL